MIPVGSMVTLENGDDTFIVWPEDIRPDGTIKAKALAARVDNMSQEQKSRMVDTVQGVGLIRDMVDIEFPESIWREDEFISMLS